MSAGGVEVMCLNCHQDCQTFRHWRSSCRDCGCGPDDHAHEKNPDPNKRRVGASRGSGRKTYETTESDVARARDSRKHSSNYSVDLVGSRDQRSTTSNGSLSSSSGASNGAAAASKNYAWVPPGVMSKQIYMYMEALPEEKVPKLGSPGEKYYNQQKVLQCPAQDLDYYRTRYVPDKTKTIFLQFVDKENESRGEGELKGPLDLSEKCYSCYDNIKGGEVAVCAPKLGDRAIYHPKCFTCATCNELLTDFVFFNDNKTLYCGRHHAELGRKRCFGCDELIFTEKFLNAMGKSFHEDHVSCFTCKGRINSREFNAVDNNIICDDCFKSEHAKTCTGCKRKIGPNSARMKSGEQFWHADCFSCASCFKTLPSDAKFKTQDDKIYCSSCYARIPDPLRCPKCELGFNSSSVKIEFNGKTWHAECSPVKGGVVKCSMCYQPVPNGTEYVVTAEEEPVCNSCYIIHIAKTCVECLKLIEAGEVKVTSGSKNWHDKCFKCKDCRMVVSSKENFHISPPKDVYCQRCAQSNDPKKVCFECKGPFKRGELKTEFQNRVYHDTCFVCYKCRSALGTQTFVERDDGKRICKGCQVVDTKPKCPGCREEILVKSGIEYNGKTWHRSCFNCKGCSINLAGHKFSSQDGKIFCPDCYKKSFAKICAECKEPIVAGKFFNRDGIFYHKNCFKCTKCKACLADDGFFDVGGKPYCERCSE